MPLLEVGSPFVFNVDSDTVILNYPVLGNYMTLGTAQGVSEVGTGKIVQVNGVQIVSAANSGGVSVFGYKIANTTISSQIGIVTPKTITVLGKTDVNKPVDGLTTMPVGNTGWTVDKSQFVTGDDAKIDGFAAYGTALVGIQKILVGSVSIVGHNAVDYSLNFVVGKGMIVPSQPILEPTAISLAVQPSTVSMVEVAVIKVPSEASTGMIQAEVPANQSKGFSFKLPDTLKDSIQGKSADILAKQLNDTPLPHWLSYDSKSNSFIAQNVPENGLPIKVQLISGGQKFIVEIFKTDQVVPAAVTSNFASLPKPVKLESTQLSLASPKEVGQLKSEQVAQLNELQVQKMTPEHVHSLTAGHLSALSPAKIAILTQSESNQLKLNQLLVLKPSQISQVNPAHFANLHAAEVANLNDEQIKSLTPQQIASIKPGNFGALQSEQISIMTTEQIQALSPAQFGSLTPIQLSSLTPAQIQVIGKPHLQSLNTVQRAALLPEQIETLSPVQKEALGLPTENQPTATGINPAEMTKIQSPIINNIAPNGIPSGSPISEQPFTPSTVAPTTSPNTSPITSAEPEFKPALALN